jgi:hypothetical protein
MYADYVADVIGRKFDARSKTVYDKGSVVGPLGLRIPLQWSFSHGHSTDAYTVACWKVSGLLYIAVGFEPKTRTSTVMLLDKNKLREAFGNINLVSAATRGSSANKLTTLDGYVEWFKSLIVGIWVRTGASGEYRRVSL